MPNFNKVFLMGHLTRDPELRYTPAGLGVTSFGLAINTTIGKDDAGNQKQDTLFIDVTAFKKQAELINEYFKKGDPIFVEGRLQYRTWEDSDGNKRSKYSVILNGFQFLPNQSKPANESVTDSNVSAPAEDEDIPF